MAAPTVDVQAELATLKAQIADVLNWRAGARLEAVDQNLGNIEDRLANIERKLGIKPPDGSDGGEPYARSTPPHVVQP